LAVGHKRAGEFKRASLRRPLEFALAPGRIERGSRYPTGRPWLFSD